MEQRPVTFVIKGLRLGWGFKDIVYVPHIPNVPDFDRLQWGGVSWEWKECTWYKSRSGLTWHEYYIYKNGRKKPVHRPLPISREPTFEIQDPRGGKLTNTGIYDDAIELCEKVAEKLSKMYPHDRYLLIDSCWECKVHYILPEKIYIAVLGEKVFEQGHLQIYELRDLPVDEIRMITSPKYTEILEVYNHVIRGDTVIYGSRYPRRGWIEIIECGRCTVMSPDHGVESITLDPNKIYLIFHPSPRRVKD